ncbi:MAG: beta-lactamase family protein [Phenylobacterium sp.]|nr:beta-lactamase family protein [Phenylobacterium sp.]
MGIGAAVAAALLVGAAGAGAAEPTPWTPDGPMDGGNSMGMPFPVRVVPRGDKVRGLPMAARQIAPRYEWQGRTWTVDDYMKAYNVSGVLVLKDGQVVLERYAQGRNPTDRWASQSVAKSVTSLLAGAAIQDGKMKLTDPVERFLPELKGSAYEGVTVRQILTMSSGVKWNEAYDGGATSDLAGYYRAVMAGKDPIADFMKTLPRANAPGSTFHYNTGETHLAGMLVSRAVGMPLAEYLSEKIWKPYGMERDAAWNVDRQGREFAGCCLLATLADFARIGQFALDGGVAGGKRIVPPDWIAESTRAQIPNGRPAPAGYGYFWWIGPEAYEASGIFGQSILVYPKDRLVIVINSQWPKPDEKSLFDAQSAFHRAVRAAAVQGGR